MIHDALYTIILEKIVESLNHHLETKNDTFAKLSRVLLFKKKPAKKMSEFSHHGVISDILHDKQFLGSDCTRLVLLDFVANR